MTDKKTVRMSTAEDCQAKHPHESTDLSPRRRRLVASAWDYMVIVAWLAVLTVAHILVEVLVPNPTLEYLSGTAHVGNTVHARAGKGTPGERDFHSTVTEVSPPRLLSSEGDDPTLSLVATAGSLAPRAAVHACQRGNLLRTDGPRSPRRKP
jgi:hypothetical protein